VNARRLWIAQRLTAMLLAVCVFAHLATIVYAVQGGLTAAEILARTRGSISWAAFYGVFVIAAAIHGGIGLRAIAIEWLSMRRSASWIALVVAALLLVLGLRAVVAVIA
jgi:fumarate reductase subunit C